jgi:hypothetical protein
MTYSKFLGDSGVIAISVAELKNVAHDIVTPFSGLHAMSEALSAISDGTVIVAIVASIYLARLVEEHAAPVISRVMKKIRNRYRKRD